MSDGKRSTPPGAALAWSDDADPELIVAAEATATGYQGHGLVVHDAGGAIVAASDGACGLLGLTRAELFDRTSHDSPWSAVSAQGLPVAGQDHPAMRVLAAGEAVLDSMLGVAVQTGPTSHVNRWLAVSALPILADPGSTLDADGGSGDVRLLGVLAAFTDVSDSDRGRAATALLLGNYRLLAENATDIVYRLDSDNVLLWVSPSVEAVLGWRPEQLLGTQSFALAHPDDQAKLFQWRAELIGGGVPRPVELRGRTVDGSYRWMSVQSRPAEGPDGIKGAVVGVRDINDEVLVRQALAESEKRYRLLAENSTDVVVLVNSDWTLTWVSSATRQVLGFEPKDLVGTQSADLIHPEDLPILLAARAAIDPDGKGVSYEVRVRTAYGTYLWMSGLSRTVVDSDGVEVGRISTLRDVHERVVALTALAQSESRYRMVAENAPTLSGSWPPI
jgi:PAS domain S-box-containing protein